MTAKVPDTPSPEIVFVVAVAENGVIGRDNGMPWTLKSDLARFKRITIDKPVIMGRFEEWIGNVLAEQGPDILRAKGILNIRNAQRRFVFQAVHMIADSAVGAPWKDGEEKSSKLVFIGRNLNKAQLEQGFESCLDQAA